MSANSWFPKKWYTVSMDMNYTNPEISLKYLTFLNSENGKIQQYILSAAILRHLSENTGQYILDAACGPGWFTKELSQKFPRIEGVDSSEEFIRTAKRLYKGIPFTVADVQMPLPYPEENFDTVILNMAAMDLDNLPAAFANIYAILKPTGQFIITIPNPYYTYPIGEWKRSILDILLGRKPSLKIKRNYKKAKNIIRKFNNNKNSIISNFYPLAEYITTARTAGFQLVDMEELKSATDSSTFNLQYQLYRYPLLLLLEFAKPGIEVGGRV